MLKKTLKEDKRRIGLGHSKKAILLVLSLIVLALATFFIWRAIDSNQTVTLRTVETSFKLTVAGTLAEQEKGLGQRSSLPANQGMLFSFSSSESRCFWMKGMLFPLDIIWLSPNKQVVYIQPDVKPSSYPRAFCPAQPAKYVIELNSGQAMSNQIKIGQTLEF